jgi:hypothetical protein
VEKKKKKRATWKLEDMQWAVRDVLFNNISTKKASARNDVPRETLRRHLQKVKNGEGVEKILGRKPVLTQEEEEEVKACIFSMESRLFGLTITDVRHLVYMYCEKNGKPHPFKSESQLAGKDWFYSFLKRHPDISLRKPEEVSIQRALGFNPYKVNNFMDCLQQLLFDDDGKRKIPVMNIYNVDETGYTICHKPSKSWHKRGKEVLFP